MMAVSRNVRRSGGRLTFAEKMELLIGPKAHAPSNFTDDVDAASAWRDHGPEILAARAPGQRAWGFWRFDAPEPRDRRVSEDLQLDRLGLLTAVEHAALFPLWARRELAARLQAHPAGPYHVQREIHGVPDWFPRGEGEELVRLPA